ncbi:unnamed protein product [Meloidogyne enterolobii]|uniref:Uncharacterized protein n=1 Tax=Meloidogyne enterolobii TaxID=390850 RepID=A0ACB0XRA7_MELEN
MWRYLTARNIYENLAPSGKNTLQNALINIRIKLDSPYIRELAYSKLASCYQRKGESVGEFIKRLIPLVNSTSSDVTKEVKEETLCRCFIEKVRPEYQRSLQLIAPLIGRKCFDKLATYVQELEINFRSTETSEENIQLIQGNESSWIQSTSNNTQQYTYENNASASTPKFSSEHEQYDYEQHVIENKDDEYKEYDCIEELKNEIEQMKEMINNLSEQINELKMDGNY